MPLEWHGDELAERLRHTAAEAIDDTTAATDTEATSTHPWKSRKGKNLERRIITERAREEGGEIVGRVGIEYARGVKRVRDGFYGLLLEKGTVHMDARPFLRPAADLVFPTLARRIKEKLG